MESPIPEKEKCPSFETLSAVFDRECSEEAVLSHVRECEICQKTLKELEGLERALKLALERETPADLSERILAGFHDREKARERKFTIHPGTLHFARAAALIAVLALVGYMVWDDYSTSSQPVTLTPRIAQSAGTAAELGAPDRPDPLKRGMIDATDLSTVSFSNSADTPIYPSGATTKNAALPIPDEVAQVWSVPTTSSSDFREDLRSLIQSLGIPSGSFRTANTEKGFNVRFKGTKLQTVKFVKICKALGYSLLSPVQPQPEQNRFAGKATDVIEYNADFVSR